MCRSHLHMCLHGISGDLQSWLEPQQGTNLSAFVGGIFGVNKKCPVLLPQFCRQKPPGLPSTSSTHCKEAASGPAGKAEKTLVLVPGFSPLQQPRHQPH